MIDFSTYTMHLNSKTSLQQLTRAPAHGSNAARSAERFDFDDERAESWSWRYMKQPNNNKMSERALECDE
jgi:hypothetical protein